MTKRKMRDKPSIHILVRGHSALRLRAKSKKNISKYYQHAKSFEKRHAAQKKVKRNNYLMKSRIGIRLHDNIYVHNYNL